LWWTGKNRERTNVQQFVATSQPGQLNNVGTLHCIGAEQQKGMASITSQFAWSMVISRVTAGINEYGEMRDFTISLHLQSSLYFSSYHITFRYKATGHTIISLFPLYCIVVNISWGQLVYWESFSSSSAFQKHRLTAEGCHIFIFIISFHWSIGH